MSEANTGATDALLRRISELESSLAKANGDAKKYRLRLRAEEKAHGELKEQHKALETERDGLKKSPDEWKKKHDDLQIKLRAKDAETAWSKAVGESLAPKVTLEKLWSEIGYTPGEAAPKPEEIAELVKNARESVPYLFTTDPRGSTQPTAKPPLKETAAGGRGAPDTTASRVTVKRSQLQDPKWALDPANKKMLADARMNGGFTVVDD